MPSLPPPRTTELFYGGAWHNISGHMRESSPVTITRGVSAEGNQPDPMAATATLDNRSGDYSPRNPHSALYGLIGRNTPWRFSVEAGGPWAELSSTHDALVTPGTAMTVSADLDVRVDVTQLRSGIVQHMVGRWATTGNQRSWALSLTFDSLLQLRWSLTGEAASVTTITSTAPLPLSRGQRAVLRVTLDVNNGAGGSTAAFYYGQSMNGPWRPVGTPVVTAGSTIIWPGTAQLEFGSVPGITWQGLGGRAHALQLRNGIDGPVLVDLDVAANGTPGASAVTGAGGRVWTLRDEAYLSNRHVRMVGEVPAWPPSRDLSGADRTVAIAPAGIMRRLGAGNKPLASALQRFILGSGAVIDCWPLTDGPQSQWANSLMGGPRLQPIGDSATPVKWAKGDLGDWIEPVAAITRESNGSFTARLPRAPAAESGWAVDCLRAGNGVDTGMTVVDYGAGTVADPQVQWTLANQNVPNPDTIMLFADVTAGTTVTSYTLAMLPATGLQDGLPHHLRLQVTGGATTSWSLLLDGAYLSTGSQSFRSHAPASLTYEWNENFSTAETTDLSIGYLTYWGADAPWSQDVVRAYRGFEGEPAGTRVLRVAAERGVPVSMYGLEQESTLLGVQRPEKFLDTLNTVARTDLGYVLEARDALELVYRGRDTLYNQAPIVTLDWANGVVSAPFRPTDDDKNTQNDVTVKRDGGVESTAVLEDGPMSVQDPPDGVGRYDVARTLSLASDAQAPGHAYWRLYLGTYDGLRYAKVTVDLGNPRGYALLDQLYRADVGDLLRIINLPPDYGGGSVDLLIRGYSEEVGASRWQITFTCDPGEPWTVGVVGDPDLGRVDTSGSQLELAVSATDTALPVRTTVGRPWITDAQFPAEFPFDVQFGGEHTTVTAIVPSVCAYDTFTRTASSTWGTADSGNTWIQSGGTGAERAVNGSAGTITLASPVATPRFQRLGLSLTDCEITAVVSVSQIAAGGALTPSILLRRQSDSAYYAVRPYFSSDGLLYLSLYSTGQGMVGGLISSALTYTAGQQFRVRARITGQRVQARVWRTSAAEPSTWLLDQTLSTGTIAAGDIGVLAVAAAGTTNVNAVVSVHDWACPQVMTVTRAVNGIAKAHAAGADVRLVQPTIVAL
ncbi:hypothetical protein [[Kitasatospora] papulosa]|uniref:hypothetical protein n=1 Tax=[Kitasatospora] papulosa TaxID=1464011 RepID=UPI0038091DF1